jgi:hypothetical protein
MVGAAILLDELEHAVANGDGAAATVAVCPIVATELAGGHKRVVVGVRLRLRWSAGGLAGRRGAHSRQARAASPGSHLEHRPDRTLEIVLRWGC